MFTYAKHDNVRLYLFGIIIALSIASNT